MPLVLADRVKETTTSVGTGTITLDGAATGFQSFAVIGNGNTTYYTIAGQGTSEWEVGIGTYTASGTTLSRDTVLASSAGAPNKTSFSSGIKDVFVTYTAARSVNVDGSTLDTFGLGASAGQILYCSATNTFSLLNAGTSGQVLTSGGAGAPSWTAQSSIAAGTAATLATARNINEVSFNGSANINVPRVYAVDDRTAAPADFGAQYATVGFGSWANNNTSPYADYIAFRTYGDGTGGNDNMLALRKDALGLRVWQQTFGSASAFSSFKDVAWTDGSNAAPMFNNMGNVHSFRTSFDATTPTYDFGWRYVQGSTNGPGTGGSQYYSWYIGLGSEYPATGAGSYGAMFAVDRNITNPSLSVRFNENNSFGQWRNLSGPPPGSIVWFAASSAPAGYLSCNGASLSTSTYAALFAAIGYTFGGSGGSFNIPDLRGEFIRGWDAGRGVDPGRSFGSFQDDAFQGHRHGWRQYPANGGGGGNTPLAQPNSANIRTDIVADPITNGTNGTPRTASETRPRNRALLPCIKF